MPDQIPSATLDSTNSFDSLFALDIDTKQRFDNILNQQQNPIDYPLPDYKKDSTPKGLPQDDLLNPVKMKGTLGEALFSPDARIADSAVSMMRAGQSKLPVSQGVGVPDHFQYSKVMDKFLNGDFGYNPYTSMEDNEDFNYRYDYMNQGIFEKVFKNLGTGLARFVGGVALKLGQTVGYMGSMVGNGIEEIFDGKNNNFMADVADNSLSRWFEGLEEDMKNSNLLSVFKPKGWDDKGFFNKMGNGAFWTDEVADGAAFMGEMVASMYLLGGLGKVGALGRFGATEINLAKSLGKLGSLGKYTGKTLDFALRTATGAEDLSGIGRWAFATTSESAFEASGLYKTRKDDLRAERQAGRNEYTDAEIEAIAGDSAAASFKANMLVLSASNAFENKFIFNPLFKKMGMNSPNPRGRLVSVNQGTGSLEELAQASRREYKYSTWLGKKLDWKNSNSRLRFYGGRGLSAIAAEGFWEENAQLAIERLAGADNLSFSTFAKKLKEQTVGAITGTDPQAAENIGLGGLIGIGGTGAVSKIRGGDKLFQGERRKIETDTAKAIEIYENSRRNFLSFQDIYVRDPQTQKPILDEDGNLQVDDVKAAGLLDGMNAFASKQEAAMKMYDPLFRKNLQDNAMMDFVVAAKNAGIYDRSVKRFDSLGNLSAPELENLGFDPSTTVDAGYMKDSMKEFGKIYEDVQQLPAARRGKSDTIQDELSRKHALYKAKATVYSHTKLINEYQSKMLDRDFPSAFSAEAEGNISEVQQYNSLVYQKEALDQWADLAKENGNFYDGFVRAENRKIEAERKRIEAVLDSMMDDTDANLQVTPRGFVISTTKYSDLTPSSVERFEEVQGTSPQKTIAKMHNDSKDSKAMRETEMNMDIENSAQRKHAQLTNERSRSQYLVSKFGNINDGIGNYKDYIKFYENIQKKDAAQQAPEPTEVAPVQQTPVQQQAAPVQAQTPVVAPVAPTKKEALASEAVITTLTDMLKQGRAAFASLDPNADPGYTAISNFIEENIETHRVAIQQVIDKLIHSSGDIILNQVNTNIFDANAIAVETYNVDADFLDNLMNTVDDLELKNAVFDYMDSVDNAMKNFKKIEVELTEAETGAIQILSTLNLATGPLAAYGAILTDPKADNQSKKEALRYISDQLLAPATAEATGTALGRIASEAIEAIGYPAPQESADLQAVPVPEEVKVEPVPTQQQGGDEIKLPPLVNLPIEQRVSDRFIKRYPAEIAGMDTKLLIELAGIEYTDKDILPASYYNEEEKLLNEYPEAAVFHDETSIEITKQEAEFFKRNPGFSKKLVDAISETNLAIDFDNDAIEAAQLFLENNTQVIDTYQLSLFDSPKGTQAETAVADTEGSGIQQDTPPPPEEPPVPPQMAENSEGASAAQENFIDVQVDEAKRVGRFIFPQISPEEIVMEGSKAKITNGAIQLKTTTGDQQIQLFRQHNVLKNMGDKNKTENFWSEDEEGNPKYKIKLEIAGFKNEAKYAPWIYNTAKGLTNMQTGKPFLFPYVIAMVVDQQGSYVYFDNNGNISDKTKGKPFGFTYNVEDYKSENLDLSRRGLQTGSMEPLNGAHGYLNENPLMDLSAALQRGVEIYGSIEQVTDGKLSTYNVDNSGATYAKEPQQRTVAQMEKDGDITDTSTFVLTTGNFVTFPLTTASDTAAQEIKVGQPYLFDEKTGYKIPLRGKKLKDLTIDGKPFITGELKDIIEGLQKDGKVTIPAELATSENEQLMENLFNMLRALVYSRNTPIFMNEDKTQITMLDQRPDNKPLMETEVNYSTGISTIDNPFLANEEGFSYDEFVKENFLSGAVPAELTKGQKEFEKLNRRVIFMLEKTHQEVLDAIGSKAEAKSIRMKATDVNKFINKTYRKKGGTSTVTITGYSDGKFTITGQSGTVEQSADDFIKSLRNLEEVKLAPPDEDTKEQFDNNIKLTETEEKELNEKAKNISKEELDNLNFDC